VHPQAHIEEAIALAARGLSATEIARRTGHSRSTIRGWLALEPEHHRRRSRCAQCGGPDHDVTETSEYVYLLGLYLGDGCISTHPRGVYRLRMLLDAAYPGIVEECVAAMSAVMPRNRVNLRTRTGGFDAKNPASYIEVSVYSKAWPCLFPQHGAGRKHERPIVLAGWQTALVAQHPDRLLRGLIHSDGCRFINSGRNWTAPRYSFSNRSADIHGIYREACDQLGLRWTRAPHTTYVSRVADVARMDEFIGPKA
jgi:hypothetical protein